MPSNFLIWRIAFVTVMHLVMEIFFCQGHGAGRGCLVCLMAERQAANRSVC